MENRSDTAGSTSICKKMLSASDCFLQNGNANRLPSNSGKFFYWLCRKEPTDRVASRHSSRLAGRNMISLYENLCSYGNLMLAYSKARKNKTALWYVKEFEKELERNIIKLESELRRMTYKPQSTKTFTIRDPKTRVINASHFRDRIVHHAIVNVLEPIFEKSFIFDSYASRKGKGTHAAIKQFDSFKWKCSNNGKYACYVLKSDIKHYFDTVDHKILISIIRRRIKDEKLIELVKRILDNYSENGKGMPIGNLTSQFFANAYLNELDYFAKHGLRAKFYIRYLDDFVILHSSKDMLESYMNQIDEFLQNSLQLELHPQKSFIRPLHRGITFLGFRIFYYHKLLKKSNKRQMKHRIEHFIDLYEQGIMDKYEILESFEGWNAYAIHGNIHNLRKRMMKRMNKSLLEMIKS